jgi:host factor-I protein
MPNKPKINIQDQLLFQAKKKQQPIKIYLLRGLMLQGKVLNYDNYTVLIDGMGKHQLIFKHAISTIDFPSSYNVQLPGDRNNSESEEE